MRCSSPILSPPPSTITFAIPGAGPHTITLASALPDLTANGLIIDGASQPGTQRRDLWAGNGHDLRVNLTGGTGFDGLRLRGANQLVRGLSITNFSDGIALLAGSNMATLNCNYIGLLANGTSRGNASLAIMILGASARIGGLEPVQGNVVSANAFGIITNAGSTDTAIRGNFIGTHATGMSARQRQCHQQFQRRGDLARHHPQSDFGKQRLRRHPAGVGRPDHPVRWPDPHPAQHHRQQPHADRPSS